MNKYLSEWLASGLKRRRVLKEAKVVEYITQHDEHMYDLAAYDTWLTWREPRANKV